MTTGVKLFIAVLAVAASTFGFWKYFNGLNANPAESRIETPRDAPSRPAESTKPVETAKTTLPAQTAESSVPRPAHSGADLTPSAAKYIAPPERSLDMQMFDKAVLYLIDIQEPDGHFDSAKAGAAPEFCNLNGDIANTALAAWVLMGSSSGRDQNPPALAGARKAVQWLESKIKPDGFIVDPAGPGEPVISQLFATDMFRLAAAYSTRDKLRQTTNLLASAALMKMRAKNGGFGPDTHSDEPRSDVLALAAFVFKYASLDGFKFDAFSEAPKTKDGSSPFEDDIIANLRAGMKRLDAKVHPSGAVFAEKAGGKADWRATIGGMQAIFLINPSRAAVNPALDFIFGEFDKKTESYPLIPLMLSWGKSGEGYDALTLWQGTISVIYMFTDDKYQYRTWAENVREMLRAHQERDGSWPVAGLDAKRGKIWRTTLHAMTLILTAPPPPPPGPPPDPPAPPAK
ncbi:MAG TPA: hypothetical protein VKX17_01070 [Planctomycetota bacterium]|nr:hypothetical protein [Planctomycetota bacterium]